MWTKIKFFESKQNQPWMISHYQAPSGIIIDDKTLRVFCAARDADQISSAIYLDLKIDGSSVTVSDVSYSPVLEPGPIGHFDEHGIFPSSVVFHNGTYHLFYIGWTKGVESPLFYSAIGLATSKDGISFERHSPAPIIERSRHDPCLVTAPHVYKDKDGWRMNYVSGFKWERDNDTGKLKSYYHIKSALSKNLIDWKREGRIAIDLKDGETNIAKPCVLKFADDDYRMWYSYVHSESGKYLMGYAHSNDGLEWTRDDDNVGIGLDNEYCQSMICYPFVFKMGDRLFMLYNGDNYGQKGFGIAQWTA